MALASADRIKAHVEHRKEGINIFKKSMQRLAMGVFGFIGLSGSLMAAGGLDSEVTSSQTATQSTVVKPARAFKRVTNPSNGTPAAVETTSSSEPNKTSTPNASEVTYPLPTFESRLPNNPKYFFDPPAIPQAIAAFMSEIPEVTKNWNLTEGANNITKDAFSKDDILHKALQKHSPTYSENVLKWEGTVYPAEMVIVNMFSELFNAGVMLNVDPKTLTQSLQPSDVFIKFMEVVKGLDLVAFKSLDKLDEKGLIYLANNGNTQAQVRLAEGYAEGKYGVKKNPSKLEKLAINGVSKAQWYVAEGYAQEKYGFMHDHFLLEEHAKRGNMFAERSLAKLYSWDEPGLRAQGGIRYQNVTKIEELARNGNVFAQEEVRRLYKSRVDEYAKIKFTLTPEEVANFDTSAWKRGEDLLYSLLHPKAPTIIAVAPTYAEFYKNYQSDAWDRAYPLLEQREVIRELYSKRKFHDLQKIGSAGGLQAQELIAEGLMRRYDGFPTGNREGDLLMFANQGWEAAQKHVTTLIASSPSFIPISPELEGFYATPGMKFGYRVDTTIEKLIRLHFKRVNETLVATKVRK